MRKTNWNWYIERLNALGFRNYQEYLKSAHWAKQKECFYALQEKPYHCYICGGYEVIFNVHHQSYKRIGAENLKRDLILLCNPCHFKVHETLKETNHPLSSMARIYKKHLKTGKKLKYKKVVS